jgi:hypothetical protein
MNLKQWLRKNKSKEIRASLALKSNTSVDYLLQLSNSKSTKKRSTPEMCEKLFLGSKDLTPHQLIIPKHERPDIAKIMGIKGGQSNAANEEPNSPDAA